jgi:hypothetical protein
LFVGRRIQAIPFPKVKPIGHVTAVTQNPLRCEGLITLAGSRGPWELVPQAHLRAPRLPQRKDIALGAQSPR